MEGLPFGAAPVQSSHLQGDLGTALVLFAIVLATGMIWGRIIWGIWWTWDVRLTSALICVLLYAGYLILRRSIDEPRQRAQMSAVFALFALTDIPIVWFSIRWFRTQHPAPMELGSEMMHALLWNWFGMGALTAALVLVRLGQEEAVAALFKGNGLRVGTRRDLAARKTERERGRGRD